MIRPDSFMGFFLRRAQETVLSIALFLFAIDAYAQDETDNVIKVRAGLGILVTPQYEGAETHHALPLLSFRIDRELQYLEIRGNTLLANVLNTDKFEFGPLVHFRAGRDSSVDNAAASQLPDIDLATEVGFFVSIPAFTRNLKSEVLRIGVEFYGDVSDTHNGLLASIYTNYQKAFSQRLFVGGKVFMNVVDDAYASTYFSVNGSQAESSGLARHEATAGPKDAGIQLNLGIAVTRFWIATTFVRSTKFNSDFSNSPIVREVRGRVQTTAGISLSRRF